MSLLYRVIVASACRNTHHQIAMDALRHLRGQEAQAWTDVFLRYHQPYLEGSKAPDEKFKDFKNHVLHVRQDYWGGALGAAKKWYETTLAALRQRKWSEAAYSAGVLSHYFTDPHMPFHTDQSEAEGKVHRAAEWSIACSYGELQSMLGADLRGYPHVEAPQSPDWLADLIKAGANFAHPHYEVLIDRYDLESGLKNPPLGLDQECKDRVAACLGQAVVGFARVLERVIAEADVTPPVVDVTLQGFLAALQMPIRYVLKKIDNAQQRSQIQAIYDEVQATGKVIQNLPADEKAVRELYAQEVLKIPLAQLDAEVPRVTGHAALAPVAEQRPSLPRLAAETHRETPKVETLRTEKPLVKPALKIAEESTRPARVEPLASVTPATGKLKFRLNKRSEIVDAPSIGGKTAARLQAAGIKTVGDLLAADPIRVAATVGAAHIESDTIRQWQAEALLVCRVPELYGHDAQILVASGIREPQDLAALTPAALLDMVTPFVDSSEGQRILRSSKAPDLEEVTNWIAWGRQARSLKAA